MNKISGKSVVYNKDDISTDQIFPGAYVNETDKEKIAGYTLIGADKTIKERFFAGGNIFVTGNNFGCGSSREQAVISLQACGVKAVIAKSAARIWYRNAINLALPVIICERAADEIKEGDEMEIELDTGKIKNLTSGKVFQGQPLSAFIMNIFTNGGVLPMMQRKNKVIK